MGRIVVIAIGGNAISSPLNKNELSYDENLLIDRISKSIAKMQKHGDQIIITHGNGPQVGLEMRRGEAAQKSERKIKELKLHSLIAQTQSLIGISIERSLRNHLKRIGKSPNSAVIITHVIVDSKDSAFNKPSKPIGKYLTKRELKIELMQNPMDYIEKDGMFRIVVPSPKPLSILEIEQITFLSKSSIVIACGGGGIPICNNHGKYKYLDCVIDKDAASFILAKQMHADVFIILTDAEYLYSNFDEKIGAIKEIDTKSLRKLAARLEEGSMRPKAIACADFSDATGNCAYIGNVGKLKEILEGKSGTKIINRRINGYAKI